MIRKARPILWLVAISLLCLFVAYAAGLFFTSNPKDQIVTLSKGSKGGTEEDLGALIKFYIDQDPAIDRVIQAGDADQGSNDNLKHLRAGKLDAAFVMATSLLKDEKDWENLDEVRLLCRPYSDVIHVVVHEELINGLGMAGEDISLESILDKVGGGVRGGWRERVLNLLWSQ